MGLEKTDWDKLLAEMDREDRQNDRRQEAIKRKLRATIAAARQAETGRRWYANHPGNCVEDDYSEDSFP